MYKCRSIRIYALIKYSSTRTTLEYKNYFLHLNMYQVGIMNTKWYSILQKKNCQRDKKYKKNFLYWKKTCQRGNKDKCSDQNWVHMCRGDKNYIGCTRRRPRSDTVKGRNLEWKKGQGNLLLLNSDQELHRKTQDPAGQRQTMFSY